MTDEPAIEPVLLHRRLTKATTKEGAHPAALRELGDVAARAPLAALGASLYWLFEEFR